MPAIPHAPDTVSIKMLQTLRHKLLDERKLGGADVRRIDYELTVIRAQLQALYALRLKMPAERSNGHVRHIDT